MEECFVKQNYKMKKNKEIQFKNHSDDSICFYFI